MSSQSAPSIPFTFTHSQQAFRLLELPPEILQLLKSSTPPTLTLKSSSIETGTYSTKLATNGTNPHTSTAHLITPTQSYEIRQVSTSNSVFITSPEWNVSGDADAEGLERDANTTSTSISAISNVDSVLELHAVNYSAKEELLHVLPVWFYPESESSLDVLPPIRGKTKPEFFSDIPIPTSQLELSYLRLLAFSISETKSAVRPSNDTVLRVWKEILITAVERSIDLSSFFYPSALCDDTDHPDPDIRSLRNTVLKYLTYGDAETDSEKSLNNANDFQSRNSITFNSDVKLWIQKPKCLKWTGEILLKSQRGTESTGLQTSTFLSQWKDLLPESWREDAKLPLLEDMYYMTEDGSRRRKAEETLSNTTSNSITSDVKPTPETKSSTGGKRKWHEKFRVERDARAEAASLKKR